MTAFTLDTSGAVPLAHHNAVGDQTFVSTFWSDLDAFTQGYFRAQAEALWESLDADIREAMERGGFSLAFSDWSHEALAMILADCAAFQGGIAAGDKTKEGGALFWKSRRTGELPDFPPRPSPLRFPTTGRCI